jgi:hypothetical protein
LDDSPQLRPRDKLLRDTFTPAEMILFTVLLVQAQLVFWLGDPRSFWLLGSLLILGCLTPVILKTHEHTHPFFIDLLWPKFWICTAPAWLLALQFVLGLLQNPLGTLTVGKTEFSTLDTVEIWRPTSTADAGTWLIIFGFCAAYILTTSLYLVPKSRSYFERFVPWLCLGAVLVAVFGIIQKGLGLPQPLFTSGTGRTDFFAFFPYDGHWAAFASLWLAACFSMALLSTRYENSPPFIHSIGPWYLTGGVILGASGFLVQAPLASAVLLLTLSVMLLIVAIEFLVHSRDIHRKPIAICSALTACLVFAGGIIRIFQKGAYSETSAALRQAAWQMFLDNPVFGWGIDSYEKLLPFYGSDTLLGQRSERAASDLLQLLAELGIFGSLVVVGILIALIARYFRGRHNVLLSNHLLIGCGSVLLLGLVDTPFMSPAVFVSFLVILFSALRWAELSRNNVDEVDASRPQLVTPESQRRVPFFNKPYEDIEK